MKFTAVASALTLASVAQAVTVITPWANSTWVSGGDGVITWKSDANEAKLKCDIQLMNGNAANANMVAFVTAPETPVACSDNSYKISPINDFASGKYSIRVGQISTNTWAYSGLFEFQGKGTAQPKQTAGNGAPVTTGAAATGTPAGSTPTPANNNKDNKTASGSAANASSSTSGAGSINAMSALGLVAVAGLSTLAMSL
ncbi:unnamed protein product [Cunninghamella echinulata]